MDRKWVSKSTIFYGKRVHGKGIHRFVENKAEVHFQKGRIKFLDNNGNVKLDKHGREQSSPYPSVWIIYRGD